ncbi:MAG: stage V sporulation protein D [Bacilli bacterium]|nr:stage V sporulation protein D [Bacilli bacterium]
MFNKKIHKRIKITLLVIIFCFILIIGKVFYIQVIDYDKLNNLANNLWSRNLIIGANRGRIITSDNVTVASNLTTVSLVVIPNQIKNKDDVVKDLANILNVDEKVISEHVNKRSSVEIIHPEGRQLSFDVADKINELNYEGVYLLKEGKRYYPYNTLLSHSIGYVGIDNQGLSGLELTYDKYLTGVSGAIKYFSDAKGNKLEKSSIYEEPTNGMDLYLTINYDIQAAVERELNNVMDKYNANGAWAIVMNPNNGEILALSSKPDFDPSNYKNYSTEVINRNHAVWATYEPGSTFKIITLAASIEENTVDLINDTFHDSGSVNVDGARIKCWKSGGHGSQTYLQVVQNSCNPGFVSLGNKLGKEKLFKYINLFGFGEKTGIDLNGEGNGILFNLDKVGPVELATTAFGQGISVTAIQQITAVSAAINGGTLYKPYIVKRIVEPNTGEIIEETKPHIVRKVISNETSRTVRSTLETVVAYGTGRNAYIEGYRVGGKTGTAQKVQNGIYLTGNYIVSFIGFLPADNPQAVVYVAIDNPKGITQYGGTVSAPIAKNIMIDVIASLNIKKSEYTLDKEEFWYDIKYTEVPNVIGLTIKEAKSQLKKLTINYSGTGNIIKSISPEPGTIVKENSTIKILLSN